MRYLIPLAVLLAGCALQPVELAEGCGTDTECEEQCIADLRPDESPEVCAISLTAAKQ